jgi:hypothetical protein
MDLKEIAKQVHKTAVEKGWWSDQVERSIGDQITNFHAELSEAWEEYRTGNPICSTYIKNGKPEGFGIELADCIIRILDTCAFYGIDIQECIRVKAAYNETRPFLHGNKRA